MNFTTMAAVGVMARSGGVARTLLSHVNVRASSTMAAPGSFYALEATDLDGESGRSRDSQMHFCNSVVTLDITLLVCASKRVL